MVYPRIFDVYMPQVLESHRHWMFHPRVDRDRSVEGWRTTPHTKIIVNNTRAEFPAALGVDGRCMRVSGMFYQIGGNAASQSHFYLTDSVQNFVTGSLYFDAAPNFDSIYPAVVYLREDIMHLMETLEWE